MNALRMVLAGFAGLVSAVLTEVGTGAWLAMAPADMDLTGNLFFAVVLPVVLVVHALMAVIFWKAFEPNPTRNPSIFVAAHLIFQMVELSNFGNPTGDLLAYATVILVSGVAVMGVFNRYIWCPTCARIGEA